MKTICAEIQCTGCAACANICPKGCIEMRPDKYGFYRPVIGNDKCIDCHLCEKVCPNNTVIGKAAPITCYAGWSIDPKDRATSTSGGIASVLSAYIQEQGGAVYGSINKGYAIFHTRISDKSDLYRLKGSKYVQSTIPASLFREIRKDLTEGRKVIFFGTPCQIAGIRNYLDYTKTDHQIILVDIICHGTPSQKMLQDHIRSITDITNVCQVTFRDSYGFYMTLRDKNGGIIYRRKFPDDYYMNGFQYALFYRPSCYQCHYACKDRISDITIGDFWGLGDTVYPKEKVSVILCNTPQGKSIIEELGKDRLFLDKRPIAEAINGNAQLQTPSKKHKYYELFHKLYVRMGWKSCIKICLAEFYSKNRIFKYLYKMPSFKKWYDNKNKQK